MPPKTTTATKRTKKGGKARQTPIVEAAVPAEEFPDDPPAEEEELDAVVEPEETQGATTSQPAPAKAQPKKRNRVSHREIEDYHFTPEQVTQLVDFLKEHPQMYDRRHREFCNTPAKLDLWQQCAGLFTPAATFLQCRKYFEQKRTAFGKIEAFEMKSGSEARDRTAREEDILETWSFLKGHISHSTTTTSQRFSSDRDSSSSDMSGLSAHSIQRRKAVKKKRTGEPTPSTPPLTQLEVEAQRNRVLSSLLEQASQLTGPKQPQPQGMSTAEMYGKMIGEQLARVKKEDLLTVVIPILNILSNYFNKPQQPQPTPMHPPPAPAQTPVPRNPLPGAGPQHPMHPGPAFPPHYGQEQSPVYPVASTSGLQQQQPPHMPATSYQPTTPVTKPSEEEENDDE